MTDETTVNAKPSKDPADQGSLAGTLRSVFKKLLQGIDDCLPATVIAYDRVNNTATVQPQVMMVSTDGEKVTRAQLASIPVFCYGGGGFMLNFPLKAGDTGWIKANDRDISLFMQKQGEAHPNTARLHSFSDGVFFPDILRKYIIDADDDGCAVFQADTGINKVSLHPDGSVIIQGNVGKMTIDQSGKYSFVGAGGDEIMQVLYDLLSDLIAAQVIPANPFTAGTIAALTAIQNRSTGLKI